MANEKTNIELLKELFRKHFEEAEKLINSFEKQLQDRDDKLKELEDKMELLEDDDTETEYDNEDFVGLDTIKWSTENGNIVIEQQMTDFIHSIQKQNAVVPA